MAFSARLLAASLLASTAFAQSVDVPYGYGNVECNNSSAYPFGSGNSACRVQYIYDTSNFLMAGVDHPILIHTVHLRCNGGAVNLGGTYGSVNYRLGTAVADHQSLSSNFDGNYLGGPPPFVASGPVVVADAAGTTPNNHYVSLPIVPFAYDPSVGDDLVIEIAFPAGIFIGNGTNTTAASADLHYIATDSRGARVFASTATAATGTYQNSSAHAMRFDYIVPPGVAQKRSLGQGCGTPPLELIGDSRPLLGTTITLATNNVPASALLSVSVLSFTELSPPIDMRTLGMPGCWQHLTLESTSFLFGGPTVTMRLQLPTSSTYVGTQVISQSVSLAPGVNALGALASNALRLVLGIQ